MSMTTNVMNLVMGTTPQENQGQKDHTDGILFTELLGKAMKSGLITKDSIPRIKETDLDPEEALKELVGALGMPVTHLENEGLPALKEQVEQLIGAASAEMTPKVNGEEPLSKEQLEELLKKIPKERTPIDKPIREPKDDGRIDLPRDPTILPMGRTVKESLRTPEKPGEESYENLNGKLIQSPIPEESSMAVSSPEYAFVSEEGRKAEERPIFVSPLEDSISVPDPKTTTKEGILPKEKIALEEIVVQKMIHEEVVLQEVVKPVEKYTQATNDEVASKTTIQSSMNGTKALENPLQSAVVEMEKVQRNEATTSVFTKEEPVKNPHPEKEAIKTLLKENTSLRGGLSEMDAKLYRRGLGVNFQDQTQIQWVTPDDEFQMNLRGGLQEAMPMEEQSSFEELIQKEDPLKVSELYLGVSGLQEGRNHLEVVAVPKTGESKVLEENLKNAEALILKSMNTLKEGDRTTMKLRLHPEELGEMEVVLTLDKGKLSGRFITENLEMKNLFQEKIQELTQNLKAHQIDVSKMEVSTNMQGSKEDGPKDPRQHQPQTAAMANIRGYGKIQKEVTTYIHVPEQHKEHINLLA